MILCCCLILSLFFPVQSLHAQDLQYYYNLALKNDADLKAAGYLYEASLQVKNQAWAPLLPRIDGKCEQSNFNQDISSSENVLYQEGKKRYKSKSFTLTFTQPVVNISSLVRLSQAQVEIQASGIEFEVAKQSLITRVVEAYLNTLSSVIATETVGAEKKEVERLFSVTNKKFKYGFARITDMYDVEARLSMVNSDYIEALNLKRDAFEALKVICNGEVVDIDPLKDDISMENADPDDVEFWVENAMKNNLELVLLNHKVEIARREIRRQWAGHLPTLDIIGQYKYEDSSGDMLAGGGGNEVASKDVYLRLNIPLFEGGYTHSKVKEALATFKQVEETCQSKKRTIRRETRAIFLKVKSSIMKSKALYASLQSQKLAVQAKQKGFESGLYNLIDVLDAERLRFVAERDYANARIEYLLNSFKLKQIVGTLSATNIKEANKLFDTEARSRDETL